MKLLQNDNILEEVLTAKDSEQLLYAIKNWKIKETMYEKIKVLVACGAGIATSTVVMKRIEDLLQDNNIEADVEQIKIAEAVSKQEGPICLSRQQFYRLNTKYQQLQPWDISVE